MLDIRPEDWLKIGNDLRRILGLPEMKECNRCPTDEELAAYDKILPDFSSRFKEMARQEMLHRQNLER